MRAKVFFSSQIIVETGILVDDSDILSYLSGLLDGIESTDGNSPCGGEEGGNEYLDRRGFAGTVRPEKAVYLAFFDRKINAIDSIFFCL